MPDDRLTPTQRRLLAVLADGQPHSRHALRACLFDDLGSLSNIKAHLSHLRGKLRPEGQDIACVRLGDAIYYRLVTLSLAGTGH